MPPKDIPELLRRIAAQAKLLPKEQAIAVVGCLNHATRGTQEDEWYQIIDGIMAYHNQPQTPLVSIDTMNGNINSIEQNLPSHDHPNQQPQRQFQPLHPGFNAPDGGNDYP